MGGNGGKGGKGGLNGEIGGDWVSRGVGKHVGITDEHSQELPLGPCPGPCPVGLAGSWVVVSALNENGFSTTTCRYYSIHPETELASVMFGC